MGWLALLLAGLAGWLIWTGRLQRMSAKDGMALGAALVGAVLSAKGKPVIGAPMLIGAALFFAGQGKLLRKGRTATPKPLPPQDIAQARALLGVAPDADADMIRAAHRRLIASVHPDKGGTEALAAQINAARDLLLRHQAER
ncbi:MAG: J domain-containing protein [Pseudomonadota bacterium]|uniref:Molecular chaperone DnaJ n=1 Tax=Sphingobium xenophagum TaxID=121428 RepID=A0A249MRK7_SPHXE|nr:MULTISPECIES: DnaJ domain-containing protein [Sphingobium]MBU1259036.1 DnaJ domain-containing protein [Alphaproteobacteria bacterium]ASY43990.1 molecular chaperone DnaJ [Sphingobium xenophagum]MBU1463569.1 DnaJ domain-containing protein [Alphaproteobacteria bacterium]OUC55963.1 molecular chaperone DnaJ [Sphingobium sp. GW456-12-10-14-TSB1]QWT12830.1 DnaJ domain-containing protein [Sphingobium xenophagum]